MGAAPEVPGRAAVTFSAPHGTESFVMADGQVVAFGRGGDCQVRFGYAPVADVGVPRVAGRFVVAARRVFVESVDVVGRRSLEIAVEGRPPMLLGLGDGFAPVEPEFRVTVYGEQRAWPLSVVVRQAARPAVGHAGDLPTKGFSVGLTELQRRVIAAYMAPMVQGRMEPATHREVAAALSYHPNSVREALYGAWAKMFAAGIPMPDLADKRVAVVEAVRLHRLLAADLGDG